jgi:hypothetical protein
MSDFLSTRNKGERPKITPALVRHCTRLIEAGEALECIAARTGVSVEVIDIIGTRFWRERLRTRRKVGQAPESW